MKKRSPLYCRYNGAMLGIFMFLNRFEFARDLFCVFQKRMQQFLNEIDANFQLPTSHELFRDKFTDLYSAVLHVLTEKENGRNIGLFQPFTLGFGFLAKALDMPNQTDEAMLKSFMTESSLDPALIQEYAGQVPRDLGRISLDDVMNPALIFLQQLILPLEVETDTCFVAMPFSEPFNRFFPAIYQPLLEKNGFRSIRAWGGLSNEFHLDLLLTLIDKSGCVLAETTGLNSNVIFEMGYAFGKDKRVIQLGDVSKPTSLANTRGLAAIPYDSSKNKWEDDIVNGLGDLTMKAILKAAANKNAI
ncbi:MAG: hypothetical protein JEZ12_15545 [Desulfobacterium sp.]|nr:hypothetical protein [Desulfobacterium sp.]